MYWVELQDLQAIVICTLQAACVEFYFFRDVVLAPKAYIVIIYENEKELTSKNFMIKFLDWYFT